GHSVYRSLMNVREGSLGTMPCLVAGSGPPLVLLAGLAPEAGVAAGSLRRMHEAAIRPWAGEREVFYVNRRPGLVHGMTMAALAAEHADALHEAFDAPVDLLGASTGGSIAQQLAAEHPHVVRRLVLRQHGLSARSEREAASAPDRRAGACWRCTPTVATSP